MRLTAEGVDGEAREVRVVLGEDELVLLANALNEVANGVGFDDDEFANRIGGERGEARELAAEVRALLKALDS